MASLILKMSVSLDGYVASLDGTPDWVAAGRSFRLYELGGRDREQRRRTGVRCSSVDRLAVERRCLARLGGSRIVRVQIRLERDDDEAAVRQVLVRAFGMASTALSSPSSVTAWQRSLPMVMVCCWSLSRAARSSGI